MVNQIEQIVDEIKKMNTTFERKQGMGVDWENEYKYIMQELDELSDGIKTINLVEVIDALVDINVFAIGALHKLGLEADQIVDKIYDSKIMDIHTLSIDMFQVQIYGLINTIFVTLSSLVGNKLIFSLFHEVYLSNMSKLKDGKPVPGELPGKFGKNMETYFPPNLSQFLLL